MQVAAGLGHALLRQDARGVAVRAAANVAHGVADVQLHGQAQLVGEAQVATEGLLLDLVGNLVVGTVVQPELAHAHAARAREELAQARHGVVVKRLGPVGVGSRDDADVVEQVRRVTPLEGGRLEAALRALLEARPRELHLLVDPSEQLARAAPPPGDVVDGVDGHHEQAHAGERRAHDRHGGVVLAQAREVAVGVRERGERRRDGARRALAVVEELAVSEREVVERDGV